jgi:hypothetical protein
MPSPHQPRCRSDPYDARLAFREAVWWKSPAGGTASIAQISCKLTGCSHESSAGNLSGLYMSSRNVQPGDSFSLISIG